MNEDKFMRQLQLRMDNLDFDFRYLKDVVNRKDSEKTKDKLKHRIVDELSEALNLVKKEI